MQNALLSATRGAGVYHNKELWLTVAGGVLATYLLSFAVIYVGVCVFMEDTSPEWT